MANLSRKLPQAWRPPMGWNSWDSYGTTLTESELLDNARFMAGHLKDAGWDTLVIDIDWYDPTARAHGYNANAPLILDGYGRQLPDPERFPSAAGGKGFGPLAAAVHELGLKLGVHMMRGIPRLAVDRDLPVYGTDYTAKDVADLDHVCKWNPDNYGLNQSHPGAQAWYDAQLDLFASWGLDFLKVDDMQTPFHADEIAAYHRAIAKAEAEGRTGGQRVQPVRKNRQKKSGGQGESRSEAFADDSDVEQLEDADEDKDSTSSKSGGLSDEEIARRRYERRARQRREAAARRKAQAKKKRNR